MIDIVLLTKRSQLNQLLIREKFSRVPIWTLSMSLRKTATWTVAKEKQFPIETQRKAGVNLPRF